MKKTLIVLVLLAMTSAASALGQCLTLDPDFKTTFRNDLNLDYNDYGAIHLDATNPSCAEHAHYALYAKVKNTMDYGIHTDSEGSVVGAYQG